MNNKCLAGINLETSEVVWICTLYDSLEQTLENIEAIEESGCYVIIADRGLAEEASGKKIDHPIDIVKTAEQSYKQGELL